MNTQYNNGSDFNPSKVSLTPHEYVYSDIWPVLNPVQTPVDMWSISY